MKIFILFGLSLAFLNSFAHGTLSISPTPAKLLNEFSLPFAAKHDFVYDAVGQRVKFACVNWYGAHQELYAVDGLQVQNLSTIVTRIVELGFNCIRLPFSLQGVIENPIVPETILTANPSLMNKTHLEILDIVIEAVADENLMVVLNNHNSQAGWCCDVESEEGLWATSLYSTSQWLDTLEFITLRYKNFSNVVAFDLRNEIHDVGDTIVTWGESNNQDTDWKVASQLAGNRILDANPEMLIIVTGLCFGYYIEPMYNDPPVLNIDERLIFTTHNYGFSVWWETVESLLGLEWKTVEKIALSFLILSVVALTVVLILAYRLKDGLQTINQYSYLQHFSTWGLVFFGIMLTSATVWYISFKQGGCLGMRYRIYRLLFSSIAFIVAFSILLVYSIRMQKTLKASSLATNPKSQHIDADSNSETRLRSCSYSCMIVNCSSLFALILSFSVLVLIVATRAQRYDMLKWNLDGAWKTDKKVAPIWLGEFGNNNPDLWFRNIVKYLYDTDLDWAYWAINGLQWQQDQMAWLDETYGILRPDYNTSRQPELMSLLHTIQPITKP